MNKPLAQRAEQFAELAMRSPHDAELAERAKFWALQAELFGEINSTKRRDLFRLIAGNVVPAQQLTMEPSQTEHPQPEAAQAESERTLAVSDAISLTPGEKISSAA
jgi:hypothetical protein